MDETPKTHSVNLQLDVDRDLFVEESVLAMNSVNSESASSIMASLVKDHFLRRVDDLIGQGYAIRHQQVRGIVVDATDLRSLRELQSANISIGHFDVTICQDRKDQRPTLIPIPPNQLGLARDGSFYKQDEEWYLDAIYDLGSYPSVYRSKVTITKSLKTIVKTRFKLNTYYIPKRITKHISNHFPTPCPCDQSHLMPHITGVWHWIVHFTCRICGKTYYCSCFREAFKKLAKSRHKPQLYYADEKVPDVMNDALFRDDLCHLCRQAPSDLTYCSPMYGNSLEVRYGPYIIKTALVLENGNPEDEVRLRLGIPSGLRWVSEFELFAIVKELLPDHVVYYQARPNWLGKQSLDVFVPSLKLGIEYQGRQHYEPVDFFGGEVGFKATKVRDEKKSQLCRDNNIVLMYFKHTEKLTKSFVKKKLVAALKTFQ